MDILVANTGFEDIVYQSEFCSSGSINAVLAGSHYNLPFRTYQSNSISLCSSHCAVLAGWIKSSTRKLNVDSCLCQYFLPHHWNKNGFGVRKIY